MAKRKKKAAARPSDGIRYQGDVRVSLMRGKTAIMTRSYHNTGYPLLFKFICNCLAGNYVGGDMPCKIVLYTATDTTTDTPANPDFSASLIRTTAAVLVGSSPVVAVKSDAGGSYYSTTYSFSIPYALLSGTGTLNIYKAALMPNDANLQYTSVNDALLASYLFATESGGSAVWDPFQIDMSKKGNFSVAVEWEMSVKN